MASDGAKKETAESGKDLALVAEEKVVRRRVPLEYREYFEMPGEDEGTSFSLLHYFSVLLKKRWMIIGGTLLICVLAVVYSKLQTPVFRAAASFVPSRAQDMSSRLDASFGVRTMTTDRYTENLYLVEYYVKILNGTNFLTRVIDKPFKVAGSDTPVTLTEYYKQDGLNEEERRYKTIERVTKNLQIVSPRQAGGRTTPMVITIVFTASTPRMAAATANMILDELLFYNQTELSTTTQSNRKFIEDQLEASKKALVEAETARSQFEKSNRKIATPDLQLELDRLKRNVKLQEDIYMSLTRQLELVKIQEQENKASIDIFQRAIPPRSRTSPSIKKNVMIAGFLGLMIFCGLALAMDFVKKIDIKDEKSKELVETFAEVKGDVAKVGRLFGIVRKKK